MDEPVTDIKFVTSVDNCPEGYKIITSCPCGHDAQLWEKVIGGESGKRYLCFTKDKNKDTVIEDLYIPSRGEQYLRRGYVIIKETVEGKSPMYHRQLAVKVVPRSEAKTVVADIIVARPKDKISSIYNKTEKVNGLCICYRTASYKYTLPPTLAARRSTLAAGERVQKRFEQVLDYGAGTADGGRDLGKKFEGMRVYEEKATARARSGSDVTDKNRQVKVDFTAYAPSPSENVGIPPDADPLPPYTEKAEPQAQGQDTYKVNLTDYSPSPVFTEKPVSSSRIESDSAEFGGPGKYSETPPTAPPINARIDEVATATVSYSLGSAPPPPTSTSLHAPATSTSVPRAPPTDSTSSPYPATTTAGTATTFNPNPVSYQPSPGTFGSSYPPPPLATQRQYPSYPPTGGYQPFSSVQSGAYSYQPQPPRYPQSSVPATASGGAPLSYDTGIGFQMGGAAYPPPPQPGYQTVGANPFGQSGFSSVSGGPAPYNPFHHQPATGYPPLQHGGAQQNQSESYGFKF